MDLELTDEQRAFAQAARDYAEGELAPHAARWDAEGIFPREAFARAGITPDIVMTAMDADVIKTYVELELGVGIVAAVAWDAERDTRLTALDARHLFEINLTRLAIRRGAWLRGYAFHFIEMFVPTLTRDVVDRELKGEA